MKRVLPLVIVAAVVALVAAALAFAFVRGPLVQGGLARRCAPSADGPGEAAGSGDQTAGVE